MRISLLPSLLVVTILCGWPEHASAARSGAASAQIKVETTARQMEVTADPGADSPEARWKREEIIRVSHGKQGSEGTTMDYIVLVTVPLLLLIGLVAVVRLRDF